MNRSICVKTYDAPVFNRSEILRYAGVRGELPELEALLTSCLNEVADKLIYKVCYVEFPVSHEDGTLDLGFAKTVSKDLKKNLTRCSRVVLFAATVGIAIDRLIAKYSVLSPSKALMLQAIGTERIESLCNVFNIEITEREQKHGAKTVARFSPGYGDLPLSLQKEIFQVLDCPRKIGLTLNESLLMSPTKSVTALIGIRNS